jgi:hypothetical protein
VILTFNWAEHVSAAHKLDQKLDPIIAKSSEGFIFKIELQVQIHIHDTRAPRVISIVGTISNLVEALSHSQVPFMPRILVAGAGGRGLPEALAASLVGKIDRETALAEAATDPTVAKPEASWAVLRTSALRWGYSRGPRLMLFTFTATRRRARSSNHPARGGA